MKTIRATKAVFKEVAEALQTALCGHAPDKLSDKAKRVYRKMIECDFKFKPEITDL